MSSSLSSIDSFLASSLPSNFFGRSLLTVSSLSLSDVEIILSVARYMQSLVQTTGGCTLLRGRILALIFYEPSTRTSSSFQTAMLRLGGQVLPVLDVSVSSVSKGETIEDTIRCLESYTDACVMRHPEIGSVRRAASVVSSGFPLLNAGDGAGEHPTQALLDLFTIVQELTKNTNTNTNKHQDLTRFEPANCQQHLNGKTVTIIGDLKYGRTTHSLVKLLSLFNVSFNYVSPDFLRMPSSVTSLVPGSIPQSSSSTLTREIISRSDVLYVTRIQKERFTDIQQYNEAASLYRISSSLLSSLGAPPSLVVLHPLPRVNEIDTEFDSDPRAAYFRQMRYGMYTRMALLALTIKSHDVDQKNKHTLVNTNTKTSKL